MVSLPVQFSGVSTVFICTSTRLKAYEISPPKPFLEGVALDRLATNRGHLRLNGWGEKINAREFFVSTFEFAL